MTFQRVLQILLILCLASVFGYRAVTGVAGGWGQARGRLLLARGVYVSAWERAERGVVGGASLRSLRIAADARIDLWDYQVSDSGASRADTTLLQGAAARFLDCLCVAPASRWSLEGLGEVYDGMEWLSREQRALSGVLGEIDDPWERVGQSGRISIGLMRNAIDRAPNWFRLRDKLALNLWAYGLEDLARQEVRASARVLPLFYFHKFRYVDEIPEWVLHEFVRASADSAGKVPLLSATDHLTDLGRLYRRVGQPEEAVEILTAALARPGHSVNRAELRYHLGLALIDIGREPEGLLELEQAGSDPIFKIPSLAARVDVAERRGRYEDALALARQLRWEEPGNLGYCLRVARLASELEDWPAATEALRSARSANPEEPAPLLALIDIHMTQRDYTAARDVLDEIRGLPELEQMIPVLERAIEEARANRF